MDFIKQLGEIAFGTRLKLMTERFMQDGAKIYRSLGIDFEPRCFTMFYLLSKRSPLSISEITAELGFTQPAVTQIANILTEKKLVKIVKDKFDTRKRMLMLSPKGEALLPILTPVWDGFREAVSDLFNETGYDILLVTEKIENALDSKDMFTRVTEKIAQKKTEAVPNLTSV